MSAHELVDVVDVVVNLTYRARAIWDQPSSIGGAIDDVIVITGKLVGTLSRALRALVAFGILVVITLAIVRV